MSTDPKTTLISLLSAPQAASEVHVEQIPALLAQLRGLEALLWVRLIRAEPKERGRESGAEPERLLSAAEAASRLGVTVRWMYRHASTLPFARRLSRKALRFSETGLQRYMATRSR